MLSELGKGVDPIVVRHGNAYKQTFGQLTFSTISVMESVKGFQKNQSFNRLQAFLAAIVTEEILHFDPSAAELAGRIIGELERIGRPIGFADPMIAAIALTHQLELVTGNTTHFQEIQQLGYALVLVNWRVEQSLNGLH
jgi:tRNA(fMet)-specific endonuclease VapC